MADMRRQVGAALEVEITAPTTLEFQIAVAPHPGTTVFEALSFVLNGSAVSALEISGVHGNRIHKLDVPVGTLVVDYAATIVGRTDTRASPSAGEMNATATSGGRSSARTHCLSTG